MYVGINSCIPVQVYAFLAWRSWNASKQNNSHLPLDEHCIVHFVCRPSLVHLPSATKKCADVQSVSQSVVRPAIIPMSNGRWGSQVRRLIHRKIFLCFLFPLPVLVPHQPVQKSLLLIDLSPPFLLLLTRLEHVQQRQASFLSSYACVAATVWSRWDVLERLHGVRTGIIWSHRGK